MSEEEERQYRLRPRRERDRVLKERPRPRRKMERFSEEELKEEEEKKKMRSESPALPDPREEYIKAYLRTAPTEDARVMCAVCNEEETASHLYAHRVPEMGEEGGMIFYHGACADKNRVKCSNCNWTAEPVECIPDYNPKTKQITWRHRAACHLSEDAKDSCRRRTCHRCFDVLVLPHWDTTTTVHEFCSVDARGPLLTDYLELIGETESRKEDVQNNFHPRYASFLHSVGVLDRTGVFPLELDLHQFDGRNVPRASTGRECEQCGRIFSHATIMRARAKLVADEDEKTPPLICKLVLGETIGCVTRYTWSSGFKLCKKLFKLSEEIQSHRIKHAPELAADAPSELENLDLLSDNKDVNFIDTLAPHILSGFPKSDEYDSTRHLDNVRTLFHRYGARIFCAPFLAFVLQQGRPDLWLRIMADMSAGTRGDFLLPKKRKPFAILPEPTVYHQLKPDAKSCYFGLLFGGGETQHDAIVINEEKKQQNELPEEVEPEYEAVETKTTTKKKKKMSSKFLAAAHYEKDSEDENDDLSDDESAESDDAYVDNAESEKKRKFVYDYRGDRDAITREYSVAMPALKGLGNLVNRTFLMNFGSVDFNAALELVTSPLTAKTNASLIIGLDATLLEAIGVGVFDRSRCTFARVPQTLATAFMLHRTIVEKMKPHKGNAQVTVFTNAYWDLFIKHSPYANIRDGEWGYMLSKNLWHTEHFDLSEEAKSLLKEINAHPSYARVPLSKSGFFRIIGLNALIFVPTSLTAWDKVISAVREELHKKGAKNVGIDDIAQRIGEFFKTGRVKFPRLLPSENAVIIMELLTDPAVTLAVERNEGRLGAIDDSVDILGLSRQDRDIKADLKKVLTIPGLFNFRMRLQQALEGRANAHGPLAQTLNSIILEGSVNQWLTDVAIMYDLFGELYQFWKKVDTTGKATAPCVEQEKQASFFFSRCAYIEEEAKSKEELFTPKELCRPVRFTFVRALHALSDILENDNGFFFSRDSLPSELKESGSIKLTETQLRQLNNSTWMKRFAPIISPALSRVDWLTQVFHPAKDLNSNSSYRAPEEKSRDWSPLLVVKYLEGLKTAHTKLRRVIIKKLEETSGRNDPMSRVCLTEIAHDIIQRMTQVGYSKFEVLMSDPRRDRVIESPLVGLKVMELGFYLNSFTSHNFTTFKHYIKRFVHRWIAVRGLVNFLFANNLYKFDDEKEIIIKQGTSGGSLFFPEESLKEVTAKVQSEIIASTLFSVLPEPCKSILNAAPPIVRAELTGRIASLMTKLQNERPYLTRIVLNAIRPTWSNENHFSKKGDSPRSTGTSQPVPFDNFRKEFFYEIDVQIGEDEKRNRTFTFVPRNHGTTKSMHWSWSGNDETYNAAFDKYVKGKVLPSLLNTIRKMARIEREIEPLVEEQMQLEDQQQRISEVELPEEMDAVMNQVDPKKVLKSAHKNQLANFENEEEEEEKEEEEGDEEEEEEEEEEEIEYNRRQRNNQVILSDEEEEEEEETDQQMSSAESFRDKVTALVGQYLTQHSMSLEKRDSLIDRLVNDKTDSRDDELMFVSALDKKLSSVQTQAELAQLTARLEADPSSAIPIDDDHLYFLLKAKVNKLRSGLTDDDEEKAELAELKWAAGQRFEKEEDEEEGDEDEEEDEEEEDEEEEEEEGDEEEEEEEEEEDEDVIEMYKNKKRLEDEDEDEEEEEEEEEEEDVAMATKE